MRERAQRYCLLGLVNGAVFCCPVIPTHSRGSFCTTRVPIGRVIGCAGQPATDTGRLERGLVVGLRDRGACGGSFGGVGGTGPPPRTVLQVAAGPRYLPRSLTETRGGVRTLCRALGPFPRCAFGVGGGPTQPTACLEMGAGGRIAGSRRQVGPPRSVLGGTSDPTSQTEAFEREGGCRGGASWRATHRTRRRRAHGLNTSGPPASPPASPPSSVTPSLHDHVVSSAASSLPSV